MIVEGIGKLVEGRDLTASEAEEIMTEVMEGKATDTQIAAFLTALRMKRETVEEITAFAVTMRKFCRQIHPKVNSRLVDTCGTGGDRIKTFNISTAAAFVTAGAGVPVAKHGNRSVTSRCGSADILEQLGFNINMDHEMVEKSIEEIGIGFMFAPKFHPAMKYAVKPRKEIGIRTVFNILGPLTNPANAEAQLLGVYDESLTEPLAKVLRNLGSSQAMVVHGLGGLDEISTIGKTKLTWLKGGEIFTLQIGPEDFGLKRARKKAIEASTPMESTKTTIQILAGHTKRFDSKRDIVVANAAAALVVGGKTDDLKEGAALARESIDSGSAYEKLRSLIELSGGDRSKLEEFEKLG